MRFRPGSRWSPVNLSGSLSGGGYCKAWSSNWSTWPTSLRPGISCSRWSRRRSSAPEHLKLGRWISTHYRCSLFTAFAPLLPPGFANHVNSRITAVPGAESDAGDLKPESAAALAALSAKKAGLDEADFTKLLGVNGNRELTRLLDKKLVQRELTMPRPRVAPKYEAFLLPSPEHTDIESDGPKLPARQEGLLAAVREQEAPYPTALANKEFGNGVGQALFSKGLVAMEWVRADAVAIRHTEGGRRQATAYFDHPSGRGAVQYNRDAERP